MYVTMAFATPCALRPVLNIERQWLYLIPGLIGGLQTIFEVRSRQLELGLYCLPRAMESWWKLLVKTGYARNIPNGDVAVFMVAMALLGEQAYTFTPPHTHYLLFNCLPLLCSCSRIHIYHSKAVRYCILANDHRTLLSLSLEHTWCIIHI
ncbi:hypothetical protein BX666DRAFT_220498 [Dichotomocladium elegans]|nr:hypothetical protein BX666DRAFT_220498 [Dichotomocladium elegans]